MDVMISVGSFLPALLWGVAFANIVAGVPIDADKEFTGNLITLLNPFGLLGGLTTLLLFITHGAAVPGPQDRGRDPRSGRGSSRSRWGWSTAVVAVVFLLWANAIRGDMLSTVGRGAGRRGVARRAGAANRSSARAGRSSRRR